MLHNENEAYSIFAKEKVKICLKTIDDPNNLQWTILEYWKKMSFSDKLDFDVETSTSDNCFSYCLCLKYPNQTDEAFYACCHCDNWYHCECLNIDENLLKQIPMFICKPCYSDNLIPFATLVLLSYQLGYDLTNSDIKSLRVRHKKENNKFINKIRYHKFYLLYQNVTLTVPTSSLKCYSNRGIDNFYNKCYANASFQAILGSAIFYILSIMTAAVDQSFLRIVSEACREMVVDTIQCLSFQNTNAFRQECDFGDKQTMIFGNKR